ncbi:type VII secretion system-associated protein [Streptomyces sp. NPDC021212]|uniref:type VII secretion system-associated protein n=1 Tax=Streptomyces sp. NPDC021212 TaxID=3365118 RepID=UPI003793E861
MADSNQPVTQLDKAWLENFRKVDLADFRKALKTVTENGTGDQPIPSMKALKGDDEGVPGLPFGTPVPLAIGNLAEDAGTHGKAVKGAVVEMVTTLDGILENHLTLFKDIDDALGETIDSLFKTQGESLAAVDGQKFVDIWEDVDADLTTPPDQEGEDKDK